MKRAAFALLLLCGCLRYGFGLEVLGPLFPLRCPQDPPAVSGLSFACGDDGGWYCQHGTRGGRACDGGTEP